MEREAAGLTPSSFSTSAVRVRSIGDCIEADEEIEHQPVVDSPVDCICLAAFDGRLRLKSFLGRLVQPLFGL